MMGFCGVAGGGVAGAAWAAGAGSAGLTGNGSRATGNAFGFSAFFGILNARGSSARVSNATSTTPSAFTGAV